MLQLFAIFLDFGSMEPHAQEAMSKSGEACNH